MRFHKATGRGIDVEKQAVFCAFAGDIVQNGSSWPAMRGGLRAYPLTQVLMRIVAPNVADGDRLGKPTISQRSGGIADVGNDVVLQLALFSVSICPLPC